MSISCNRLPLSSNSSIDSGGDPVPFAMRILLTVSFPRQWSCRDTMVLMCWRPDGTVLGFTRWVGCSDKRVTTVVALFAFVPDPVPRKNTSSSFRVHLGRKPCLALLCFHAVEPMRMRWDSITDWMFRRACTNSFSLFAFFPTAPSRR